MPQSLGLCGKAAFLMCNPEDKGHLILDPETAPIIRKIYDYALDETVLHRLVHKSLVGELSI